MATITSNSGNINVSFFPNNASSVWFCDKNTAGINVAANGAPVFANTIYLGNVSMVTNVSGRLASALMNTSTPGSTENSTVVPTTAWVTSNFAKSVGTFNSDAINGTNWNVSNLNVSILKTATPLNTESSTVVPNTSWVYTNFGDLFTGNTWTGINTFSNLSTSISTLTPGDNSTTVPPTSWVNTNFGRTGVGNSWSGTNAFGTLTTSATLGPTDNTTTVPPASWVTTNFGKLVGGNSWSGGTNTFSALSSTQTMDGNTNSQAVATTSWVTSFFAKIGSGGGGSSGNIQTVNASNVNVSNLFVDTLAVFGVPISPAYNPTSIMSHHVGFIAGGSNFRTTSSISSGSNITLADIGFSKGVWSITGRVTVISSGTGSFDAMITKDTATLINTQNASSRTSHSVSSGQRFTAICSDYITETLISNVVYTFVLYSNTTGTIENFSDGSRLNIYLKAVRIA